MDKLVTERLREAIPPYMDNWEHAGLLCFLQVRSVSETMRKLTSSEHTHRRRFERRHAHERVDESGGRT